MSILDKFKNITGNRSYQALSNKYGTLEVTPTAPISQNPTVSQNGANLPINTPAITPTNTNTPITSANLKPKPALNLPPVSPITPSPILAEAQNTIVNNKSASDLAIENVKSEKDANITETQKLLEDMGLIKGKSGQYAEEAGVNANEDQLNEINNALMVENRNLANITDKYLNDPQLHGGLGTRLAQKANADSARKQADLLVSQSILQGNVDRALKIAKQKVDDELAPVQAKIDGLVYARDLNKDVWSNAEKTKLDSIIDREKTALKDLSDLKKLNSEMIVNAQSWGAPQSLITKANEILNNGGTQVDVAQALGKYSTDPLERALKNAQLNKLNTKDDSSTAPKIEKINGVDMQWDGTKWVTPTAGGGDNTAQDVTTTKNLDNIQTIQDLSTDKVGIRNSAGLVKGNGIIWNQNKVNDWRAKIDNTLAQLTVDELARIKGTGVTFGALSEGERQAVASAATALNSAKNFKGTGDNKIWDGTFNASENFVKSQLDEIQKYATIDFVKRTGMTPEDYKAKQDVDITDDYAKSSLEVLQEINSPFIK